MNAPLAVARNRFGLGASRDDHAAGDAREWLLSQFAAYQPGSAPWQALPRTEALVASYYEAQRAVQGAGSDADRQAAQKLVGARTREAFVGAVAARTKSALETPA